MQPMPDYDRSLSLHLASLSAPESFPATGAMIGAQMCHPPELSDLSCHFVLRAPPKPKARAGHPRPCESPHKRLRVRLAGQTTTTIPTTEFQVERIAGTLQFAVSSFKCPFSCMNEPICTIPLASVGAWDRACGAGLGIPTAR